MHVITFASTKGGVGKSTMAAITTDSLLRKGYSVRAIDVDPQGNFRNWAEAAQPEFKNLTVTQPKRGNDATFHEMYDELVDIFEEETDWVIIDTAGQDHFRQHPALAISDLVICPSGPVKIELVGVQKTVAYLKIALEQVDPDLDPMDILRILYQKPNGFPDKTMRTMREVLYKHFGVVDEFHQSSAIKNFVGEEKTTDQAIAALKSDGKDPKSFIKIQEAADRLTTSIMEQFNG